MNRILTTHVGSLPRSERVAELIFAHELGSGYDPAEFDATMADAVGTVVKRQVESGVDLVSDGEQSKISYATYIKDRITGFDGDSPRRTPKDLELFPSFMKRLASSGGTPSYRRPRCVGPIAPKTLEPLAADIKHFRAAIQATPPTGTFMNAASPGVIALFQPNEYYPSHQTYLEALAEAMRPEYEAIVAAGLTLQLDCPDLGLGRHMMFKDKTEQEYVALAHLHVEAMNHALRNIPAEKVRMHICWGNYEGPHHCDAPMDVVLPIALRAKPQALLFESANPRHAHEWTVFRDSKIPDDKILVPGVLDSVTNFIEHPLLVAERITRFADIVGRDRVIAGTDCGFSTFAGFGNVDAEIVYAKLGALTEGAAIASKRLWGQAA
ncbi:MAG: cobalamin-independent methionine synthase II family protein [Burkholderiales bacterium]